MAKKSMILKQQAVGLVQLIVIRGLGPCKGFVGIHPHPDQRPLLRSAFGGEVPQDLCLHRRARELAYKGQIPGVKKASW